MVDGGRGCRRGGVDSWVGLHLMCAVEMAVNQPEEEEGGQLEGTEAVSDCTSQLVCRQNGLKGLNWVKKTMLPDVATPALLEECECACEWESVCVSTSQYLSALPGPQTASPAQSTVRLSNAT